MGRNVLELTVRPEPQKVALVRHRVAAVLHALNQSDAHIWRVSLVASELMTLSILQGNHADVTVRVISLPDATRVEMIDGLEHMAAFESSHGRILTRVAAISGVLRDPPGHRTVWCDVDRAG